MEPTGHRSALDIRWIIGMLAKQSSPGAFYPAFPNTVPSLIYSKTNPSGQNLSGLCFTETTRLLI
jgi:hypothetical protein